MGVHRTRVGYAGGHRENPTYRSLGDQSEVIEIEYDPAVISYETLLEKFRGWHSPLGRRPVQYRSAILVQDADEELAANRAVERWSGQVGERLSTSVERLIRFWPAEDYHQKYALRRRRALVEALRVELGADWSHTEMATQINAYVSGESVALDAVPPHLLDLLR